MRKKRSLPTDESLHAAALDHLARFAATEAGLSRILQRRIGRWRTEQGHEPDADPDDLDAQASAARGAAKQIVARLVASGAVSDKVFAESRARSLARAGRSQRAVAAHLAQRGVSQELANASSTSTESGELAAALVHARKRRAGPYGPEETTPEAMRRVLASFARAGFSQAVAAQALRMSREEAEERIIAFRTGG